MLNFSPSVDLNYLLGYSGGLSYRYIGHKVAGLQAELITRNVAGPKAMDFMPDN
jgi:hypothetical protein